MTYLGTKSMAHGRGARGFYTLFYRWSTLNFTASSNARHFHRTCTICKPASPQNNQSHGILEEFKDDTSRATSWDDPLLSSHVRKLMRTLPHSVVVATSTAPSTEHGAPPSFKGMTVSSFTTLTLTPSPIVTFNIRKPSQTLEAISKSKQFFIHTLSATASGARVADAFTKGNGAGSDVFLNSAFTVLKERTGVTRKGLDPPLLAGVGIIQAIRCELLNDQSLIEVGDHVLILGKVVGIIESSANDHLQNPETNGLCYLNRSYRMVGSEIRL